jgi:hypothetical protein
MAPIVVALDDMPFQKRPSVRSDIQLLIKKLTLRY